MPSLPLPASRHLRPATPCRKLAASLVLGTWALGMGGAPLPTPKPAPPPPAAATSGAVTSAITAPRTHDPSTIVKDGGEYWYFSTGPGIVSRHSKDLATWTAGPPVFETPPAWAEEAVPGHRGYFWAPEVIYRQGKYHLYYSISTFGKNRSVIALATTPTLDPGSPKYHWTDEGPVIRSQPGDRYNAIDPAVLADTDNRLWMAFGSFWSGLKLVELDPASGKLKDPDARRTQRAPETSLHALAQAPEIEAAGLTFHGGHYYLFVNHGLCCKGLNSTYEIRMGRSQTITGPYLDASGADLRNGGGTLLLGSQGRFHGPGHAGFLTRAEPTPLGFPTPAGETLMSFHYYDANNRGQPALGLRRVTWTRDGWPSVE